jgi:hypothetical protein
VTEMTAATSSGSFPNTGGVYTNSISAGVNTISISGGGGGYGSTGVYYPSTIGTAATSNWPLIPWNPVNPNELLLNDSTVMDALIGRIVTKVDANKTLIVCVDGDCSPEVLNELTARLTEQNIPAVVIRGARAGYGYPANPKIRDEDKRVDMLARIGELWEQRPDMGLTELFQWYAGARMEDEDFIKCTEVHFQKLKES